MVNLDEYRQRVQQIRKYATDHDVSKERTSEIFQTCFQQLEAKYSKRSNKLLRIVLLSILLAFISIILLRLYNQRFLNDVFIRISQNSIYPALYILRKLAVPIISLYPTLSGL